MSAEQGFSPNRDFRGWRVVRKLAETNSSQVYAVRNPLGNREAALKVIRPQPGETAAVVEQRFRAELALHLSIRHANVPEFFDAELLPDGTALLVLELLDGRDLASTLARVQRFSIPDALFVAVEVLRVLAVLHLSALHRDIKPSNIFLCRHARLDSEGALEKGRVRLLDFGLVKVAGRTSPTRENYAVGTHGYRSPEYLRGAELTSASDLYGVGLVLFEMLAGRPLFVPDRDAPPEPQVLAEKHRLESPAREIERAIDCGVDVRALLATLLAKDPARRYPSAERALRVARHFRGAYLADSVLFRNDGEDLVQRIERLAHAGALATSPIGKPQPPGPFAPPTVAQASRLAGTEVSARQAAVIAKVVADVEIRGSDPRTSESARPGAGPASRTASTTDQAADTTPDPSLWQGPATTFRVPPTAPVPPMVGTSASAAHPASSGSRPSLPPRSDRLFTEPVERGRTDVPEWERRIVECVRAFIHRPRCFLRPAFLLPDGKRIPIASGASSLGAAAQARIQIQVTGVLPHHANVRATERGRLEIAPASNDDDPAVFADGRLVNLWTELLHGSRVRAGSVEFVAIDLALAELTSVPPRAPGHEPTRLIAVDPAPDKMWRITELKGPLALVGSSPACDFVIDDAPDVAFAVWLRGDARLEVVSLDTSKLPYGDAVVAATIVERMANFPIGRQRAFLVCEPGVDLSKVDLKSPALGAGTPHWLRSG